MLGCARRLVKAVKEKYGKVTYRQPTVPEGENYSKKQEISETGMPNNLGAIWSESVRLVASGAMFGDGVRHAPDGDGDRGLVVVGECRRVCPANLKESFSASSAAGDFVPTALNAIGTKI